MLKIPRHCRVNAGGKHTKAKRTHILALGVTGTPTCFSYAYPSKYVLALPGPLIPSNGTTSPVCATPVPFTLTHLPFVSYGYSDIQTSLSVSFTWCSYPLTSPSRFSDSGLSYFFTPFLLYTIHYH